MNDRSILYNNVGVYLVEMGHTSVAMDLFICALECPFETKGKTERGETILANLHQYVPQQEIPLEFEPHKPFLYQSPFAINESEYVDDAYATSIILFNVGLCHQREKRGSQKAAEYYQASSRTLLESTICDSSCLGLRLSILNNFGVFCYETGLDEYMRICFDKVEDALIKEDISTIKLSLIDGVQENLENLIHPHCSCSPTA